MRLSPRLVKVGVVAVAGGALAVPALAADAASRKPPPTVRLTAEVDSVNLVDTGAPGDSQGDMLIFTQKLTNRRGRRIGSADAFCVRTAPGRMRECQGTFELPKGQVFVSGPDPDGVKRHKLAIVGGTRTYQGVRGWVTLRHVTATRDRDVFVFRR